MHREGDVLDIRERTGGPGDPDRVGSGTGPRVAVGSACAVAAGVDRPRPSSRGGLKQFRA